MKKDYYAAAGVNIDAGARTVHLLSQAAQATYGDKVLSGIGAFGGVYDIAAIKNYQHPVLVASTDGIGTKVHLAAQLKRFRSLGYDMVNHCINDILVQGATPLFFLDYVATSQLVPEEMAEIVIGMAEACQAADCALLGGETAEMPGVYQPHTFDVAGTIVGIAERAQLLPRSDLQAGDILLGLASSGLHTNGYSLARQIIADHSLTAFNAEINATLADALLVPHRNYLPVLQPLLQHALRPVKALIHITGGGFVENIPRILPATLNAQIHLDRWPIPPLFHFLQQQGNIPLTQMYRVFNMGIGMIIVVAPEHVALLKENLSEPVWEIGQLTAGKQQVIFT